MQHYTFAVNAFVSVIDQYGMEEYEFEIHETKTHEVIENVKNQISEIGVLYLKLIIRQCCRRFFGSPDWYLHHCLNVEFMPT